MLTRSPLLTAAALCLCAVIAFAQEAPSTGKPATQAQTLDMPKLAANSTTTRNRPKPATTEAEAPVPEIISTPVPKKPGFFKRLFGPRKPKDGDTATPAPSTPTPTPARRLVRPSSATPEPEKAPPAKTEPEKPATAKAESEKPSPAKSEPEKTAAAKKPATPAPDSPTSGKAPAKVAANPKATPEPPANADPEVQEKYRFDQAKAKAEEDPQVKALKAKADNAATEEESRKALRAYNKALFEKIRKTDKSVSERATRLEAALMKRLNE